MRARYRGSVAGVFALLATTVTLAPAQEFGETVEVNVVTVDVEVRDAQGRPVTDLARGDFELLEDGKPVTLTNFERVARAARAGSVAARPDAAQPVAPATNEAPAGPAESAPSRLVIFVDNLHLRQGNRLRALRQVRALLADRVPGELVLVASEEQRLVVRLPFTSDAAAIDAALGTFEALPSLGGSADRDRATAMKAIVAAETQCELTGEPCCYAVAEPAKSYAESSRADVRRTLGQLRFLIGSL